MLDRQAYESECAYLRGYSCEQNCVWADGICLACGREDAVHDDDGNCAGCREAAELAAARWDDDGGAVVQEVEEEPTEDEIDYALRSYYGF